jgi:hypothetical protein
LQTVGTTEHAAEVADIFTEDTTTVLSFSIITSWAERMASIMFICAMA